MPRLSQPTAEEFNMDRSPGRRLSYAEPFSPQVPPSRLEHEQFPRHPSWDRSGQELLSVPTSPSSNDQLFFEFFDWEKYDRDTQPLDPDPSYYSDPSFPEDFSKLITEIPLVLDRLSIGRGADMYSMATPFEADEQPPGTSEYSGQTPPDLVQGDSTSSSDQPGSPLPHRGKDSSSRREVTLTEYRAQDDEWTYPRTTSPKSTPSGYPARVYVAEEQRPKKLSDQVSGLKRRRSAHESDKRHRQLTDPAQTASVRKHGACLPCRVSKTACLESGICPKCRKTFPDHAHLACNRGTPGMAVQVLRELPDVWSRHASEEETLYSGPQFYTGKAREISIFFSPNPNSPALRATVQGYRSHDGPEDAGGLSKVNFPHDQVPSHGRLQRWIEDHLRTEYGQDFQYALDSFLFAYTQDGRHLPKHALVSKVHRMTCFYRILSTSKFWCRDPANNIVALPLSVQAQLRNIARKGFRSLEHDTLKELDACLGQQGSLKTNEVMAMWASMWQLILMYREMLESFRGHLTHANGVVDNVTWSQQRRQYQWLHESFFPLMAVLYHYWFRTKKTVDISMDWLKSSSHHKTGRDTKRIREAAATLLAHRKDRYHEFQSSETETDQLICVLAVNHEVKKLNARRRTQKPSSEGSSIGIHAGQLY